MKHALALAAMLAVSPALADIDMSHSEFFERERTGNWKEPIALQSSEPQTAVPTTRRVVVRTKDGKRRVRHVRVQSEEPTIAPQKKAVADMVAAETARRLGEQWVPSALKIAKLESGFNCGAIGPKTRHGRAKGVFQVMPGSARAMGYDYSRLRDCQYGISAGISHMDMCLKSGVKTHAQMSACHVSGVGGWQRRLNPRAEQYRRKYVRMASR